MRCVGGSDTGKVRVVYLVQYFSIRDFCWCPCEYDGPLFNGKNAIAGGYGRIDIMVHGNDCFSVVFAGGL